MLVIATRFFDKESPSRLGVVTEFVRNAHKIADQVLVAINDRADVTGALDAIHELYLPCVEEFDVQPWGYVAALNALTRRAVELGVDRILFISAEVKIDRRVVLALDEEMDKDSTVLVAGAVMGGHRFRKGLSVVGGALSVPWNTCALWNVRHLSKTGFLLISEGGVEKGGGVEEVATIALAQHLNPRLKAILKSIPDGIYWDGSNLSEERLRRHIQIMDSKTERADLQMEKLSGLSYGTIIHK